jgi:hypothetical protein
MGGIRKFFIVTYIWAVFASFLLYITCGQYLQVFFGNKRTKLRNWVPFFGKLEQHN